MEYVPQYLPNQDSGSPIDYGKALNRTKFFVAKSILLSINYTANFFFYVLLNGKMLFKTPVAR